MGKFKTQVTDDSFSVTTLGQTNFTQVYATSDVCTRVVQVRYDTCCLALQKPSDDSSH